MKTLTLAGQTFRCIDKMPAGLMLDMASAEELGGKVFRRFISTIVEVEDQERLNTLLYAPNGPDWAEFEAAMLALVGEYSSRPTARPSSSPPGVVSTGQKLRAVSFSRGTVEDRDLSSTDGKQAAS